MSPIQRDYLIYGVATLIGFGVYFGLHNGFEVDFSISLLVGFAATHGTIILGRRFF